MLLGKVKPRSIERIEHKKGTISGSISHMSSTQPTLKPESKTVETQKLAPALRHQPLETKPTLGVTPAPQPRTTQDPIIHPVKLPTPTPRTPQPSQQAQQQLTQRQLPEEQTQPRPGKQNNTRLSPINLESLHLRGLPELETAEDQPLVIKREELEEHRTVTSLFDCRSESVTNFSGLQNGDGRPVHTSRESGFSDSEYTKKIRTRVIRKIYKILHGERGVEELAAQKLSLDCEDKAFRSFRSSIEKYIECVKVLCMSVRVEAT